MSAACVVLQTETASCLLAGIWLPYRCACDRNQPTGPKPSAAAACTWPFWI